MDALIARFVAWLSGDHTPAQLCVACTIISVVLWYVVATEYTRAEVVERLDARLSAQWETYLEEKLITLRGVQCQQPPRDRSYTTERIAELSRKYFKSSGRGFSLPDCNEL